MTQNGMQGKFRLKVRYYWEQEIVVLATASICFFSPGFVFLESGVVGFFSWPCIRFPVPFQALAVPLIYNGQVCPSSRISCSTPQGRSDADFSLGGLRLV